MPTEKYVKYLGVTTLIELWRFMGMSEEAIEK